MKYRPQDSEEYSQLPALFWLAYLVASVAGLALFVAYTPSAYLWLGWLLFVAGIAGVCAHCYLTHKE